MVLNFGDLVMTEDEFRVYMKTIVTHFKDLGLTPEFGELFYVLCKEFGIDSDKLKEELLHDSRHN